MMNQNADSSNPIQSQMQLGKPLLLTKPEHFSLLLLKTKKLLTIFHWLILAALAVHWDWRQQMKEWWEVKNFRQSGHSYSMCHLVDMVYFCGHIANKC